MASKIRWYVPGITLLIFFIFFIFFIVGYASEELNKQNVDQLKVNGDVNGLKELLNSDKNNDYAAFALVDLMEEQKDINGLKELFNDKSLTNKSMYYVGEALASIFIENKDINSYKELLKNDRIGDSLSQGLVNLMEEQKDINGLKELLKNNKALIESSNSLGNLLGEEQAINIVYSALEENQKPSLAEDYLNSGYNAYGIPNNNKILDSAARKWAKTHGYEIKEEIQNKTKHYSLQ